MLVARIYSNIPVILAAFMLMSPGLSHAKVRSVDDVVGKAIERHERVELHAKQTSSDGPYFLQQLWYSIWGESDGPDESKKIITVEESVFGNKAKKSEIKEEALEADSKKSISYSKNYNENNPFTKGIWGVSDDAIKPTRFVLYQDASTNVEEVSSDNNDNCSGHSNSSLLRKISLLEKEKEALRMTIHRLAEGR